MHPEPTAEAHTAPPIVDTETHERIAACLVALLSSEGKGMSMQEHDVVEAVAGEEPTRVAQVIDAMLDAKALRVVKTRHETPGRQLALVPPEPPPRPVVAPQRTRHLRSMYTVKSHVDGWIARHLAGAGRRPVQVPIGAASAFTAEELQLLEQLCVIDEWSEASTSSDDDGTYLNLVPSPAA